MKVKQPTPFKKQRTNLLWFSYKDPITKKWRQQSTETTDETEASKFIASFMERIADGEVPAAGPQTLAAYAKSWLAKRDTKTIADDRTRLEKHVLPYIGKIALADLKPRHI